MGELVQNPRTGENHSNRASYIPSANRRRRARPGLFEPSKRRQQRYVHSFPRSEGVLLTPLGKPGTTSKRES